MTESVTVNFPETTLEVFREPKSVALHHADDMSFITCIRSNEGLFKGLDGDLWDFIGLSRIDLRERPPLDVTVSSSRDELVIFKENHFDHTFVKRFLGINIQNQMGFNQISLPKDHGTLLGSTKNLTIRKLSIC